MPCCLFCQVNLSVAFLLSLFPVLIPGHLFILCLEIFKFLRILLTKLLTQLFCGFTSVPRRYSWSASSFIPAPSAALKDDSVELSVLTVNLQKDSCMQIGGRNLSEYNSVFFPWILQLFLDMLLKSWLPAMSHSYSDLNMRMHWPESLMNTPQFWGHQHVSMGGTVALWLEKLPHGKKVPGSLPGPRPGNLSPVGIGSRKSIINMLMWHLSTMHKKHCLFDFGVLLFNILYHINIRTVVVRECVAVISCPFNPCCH